MTRILRRRFHPSRHSLGVFAAAAIIQASIIACASATSAIHCVLAAPRHGAYGFLVSLRQNGVGPEKNCADAILPKEHGFTVGDLTFGIFICYISNCYNSPRYSVGFQLRRRDA
jgi:hypothetical protein